MQGVVSAVSCSFFVGKNGNIALVRDRIFSKQSYLATDHKSLSCGSQRGNFLYSNSVRPKDVV